MPTALYTSLETILCMLREQNSLSSKITVRNRNLFEKLEVTELVKKSPVFNGIQRLRAHHWFSIRKPYFLKIYCNIIVSSMSISHKMFPHFRFPIKMLY